MHAFTLAIALLIIGLAANIHLALRNIHTGLVLDGAFFGAFDFHHVVHFLGVSSFY